MSETGVSLPHAMREIVNGWKCDPAVARVALNERIAAFAAGAMGWPLHAGVRLAQDDVLWKPSGAGPVGYHQDGVYISEQFTPVKDNSVTVVSEPLRRKQCHLLRDCSETRALFGGAEVPQMVSHW